MLVAIVIVAVVVAVVAVVTRSNVGHSRLARDANSVQRIHTTFLQFAKSEPGGRLPTPGWIAARQPTAAELARGVTTIYGPRPQPLLNTTANLYSAIVAQRYLNTDMLIGSTEVNPQIEEKQDYNFAAYRPQLEQFWDSTFTMDLHRPDGVANASYAHLALCGERLRVSWRNSMDDSVPHLGTRGTFRGLTRGDEYRRSYTLVLHGLHNGWRGAMAYADNHVATLDTFAPAGSTWACPAAARLADNIFDCDFGGSGCAPPDGDSRRAGDAWLCIGVGITSDSDPLVIDASETLRPSAARR